MSDRSDLPASSRGRGAPARLLRRFVRLVAVRWVVVLYRRVDRARAFSLASDAAFWFFLGLIPLMAVAGMLAVKVTMHRSGSVVPLLTPLPGSVRAFVGRELWQVSAWSGGTVGPIAGGVFVWLASSGVHAVCDALEGVTEGRPRPWWKKRLLSIAGCVALSVGVALITALGVGLDWISQITGTADPIHDLPTLAERSVRVGLAALVSLGLVLGLYAIGIVPAKLRRMPVLPGALLTVALQFVLGFGYSAYLSRLGDGSAYLASLSTIGVTMMTLFLMATALLVGAVLNELLAVTRAVSKAQRPVAPASPGSERPDGQSQ